MNCFQNLCKTAKTSQKNKEQVKWTHKDMLQLCNENLNSSKEKLLLCKEFQQICQQSKQQFRDLDQKIKEKYKLWNLKVKTVMQKNIIQLIKPIKQDNFKSEKFRYTSQIIQSRQQEEVLINFFKPLNIKSIIQGYVATQNSFSLEAFFNLQKNYKRALLLCETQNGQIIAAYSNNTFYQQNKQGLISDQYEFKSFLCSISENIKFNLINSNKAIKKSKIPTCISFGDDQFVIPDKADKNEVKWKFGWNSTYVADQFFPHSKQKKLKLYGSETDRFKLKKMQYFQVNFETENKFTG